MNPRISLCIVSIACATVLMPSKSSAVTSLLWSSRGDSTRTLGVMKDGGTGLLTLDSVYQFSFADLGFGSLTFVARSGSLDVLAALNQNSSAATPPIVSAYDYDYPASVSFSGFDRASGFSPNIIRALSEDSGSDVPVVAAPETSTWVVCALALITLLFGQRGRFFPSLRSARR